LAEAVHVLSTRQYHGLGLVLDRLCKLLAILSGLTLLAMAFMSLRSIVGRAFFDAPLLGDYELVQFMCAGAVAMSLPYTHWISGHVIVDFSPPKPLPGSTPCSTPWPICCWRFLLA
jgi:TRAP-type mannitol/chloroaromatic compound transport system permease small subunit